MTHSRFIPWSKVESWSCKACGECCKWFNIPLTLHEYAKIGQIYGRQAFALGLGKVYLRKRVDERCIFQFRLGERWLCGLQAEKPYVCRMWPFTVSRNPIYGRSQEARWEGPYGRTYIYADPRCLMITFGRPSNYLLNKVLPEFVDMAFGKKMLQEHSTCTPLGLLRDIARSTSVARPRETTILRLQSHPERFRVDRAFFKRVEMISGGRD